MTNWVRMKPEREQFSKVLEYLITFDHQRSFSSFLDQSVRYQVALVRGGGGMEEEYNSFSSSDTLKLIGTKTEREKERERDT